MMCAFFIFIDIKYGIEWNHRMNWCDDNSNIIYNNHHKFNVSKLNELRWCLQIMFVSIAMNKSREITRVTWLLLVKGFLSSNRNSSTSKSSNSVNKKSQCKSFNSNRKSYLLVQIHRGNKCMIFFPICIWWPMHKSRSYWSLNTNDGQI